MDRQDVLFDIVNMDARQRAVRREAGGHLIAIRRKVSSTGIAISVNVNKVIELNQWLAS